MTQPLERTLTWMEYFITKGLRPLLAEARLKLKGEFVQSAEVAER
jgi:hypothetical protein